MATDEFNGERLELNDRITYRKAMPSILNFLAPEQPERGQDYTGKIVDFTPYHIGVREGGMYSDTPLYYVAPQDVTTAPDAQYRASIGLKRPLEAKVGQQGEN